MKRMWAVAMVVAVRALLAVDPPAKPVGESVAALASKLKAAELETRLTKLEALVLREQIALDQVGKIRAEQNALYGETCKAAGLEPDPKVCAIDLNARTVGRRETLGEKPPAK